jgi:hypothetical protein
MMLKLFDPVAEPRASDSTGQSEIMNEKNTIKRPTDFLTDQSGH